MNELPFSVGAKALIKFLSESKPVELPTDINDGNEGNHDSSDELSDDADEEYEESFDFERNDEESDQILNNSGSSGISQKEFEPSYFRDDPAAYSAPNGRENIALRADKDGPLQASVAAAELLHRIQHINQGPVQLESYTTRPQVADRTTAYKFERPVGDTPQLDSYPETGNKFELSDYRAEVARLRDLLVSEKDKFKDLVRFPINLKLLCPYNYLCGVYFQLISGSSYEEFQRIPEFELSLVDFVRLKAAELYMPLQQDNIVLRRQSEQLQSQLHEATWSISALRADMEVQKKLSESTVEAFRMEAKAAAERSERLSDRLKEEEQLRVEAQLQSARCVAAEKEADQIRQEVSVGQISAYLYTFVYIYNDICIHMCICIYI